MSMGIIGIIIAVVVVIILFAFMPKNKSNKNDLKNVKSKNAVNPKNTDNKTKKEDVFKFMEFDRIMDNMIVQNNGQRYTMAIKCKGINYDLMSEVEQMSVEQGFITFLNTLKYPIQLYVQAQNVDLKSVVSGYKNNIASLQEEFNKYNKLFEEKSSLFDVDRKELQNIVEERTKIQNVYEYANDIISYVEKMSVNKNLLQRNFYVLVSYSKGDIVAADKFSKEEINEMCYNELLTRCNSIISALASSSVSGTVLNSNELADLLYTAYNRDDKTLINVREALESGFYRLYSTAVDAFEKKNQMLNEAIETEARLKAIESLEKAIEKDKYQTDSAIALETEEQIARKATEFIQAEKNVKPEVRQDAYNDVLSEYRETKKEYLPKIEEEKKETIENLKNEKEELTEKYEKSDLYKTNEHKKEVINLYEEEIKKEKDEIKEIIEKNTKNTTDDDLEDESIV